MTGAGFWAERHNDRKNARQASSLIRRTVTGLPTCRAQPLGSRFRSNVPLRHTQHFEAHHKFADGCRTEQRRVEVTMKMPFRMRLPICWTLMKAHGVRETGGKQTIVAHGQLLQNIRQPMLLRWAECIHAPQVCAAEQQGLERPDRPKRYQHDEFLVLAHDALLLLQFDLERV